MLPSREVVWAILIAQWSKEFRPLAVPGTTGCGFEYLNRFIPYVRPFWPSSDIKVSRRDVSLHS